MNSIYEEMKRKEDAEVAEAVHKFVDAADAFYKLHPLQKEKFFQNAAVQKLLSNVRNEDNLNCL